MGILNINAYVSSNGFHINPISVQINCDKGQYQVLGYGLFVLVPGAIPKGNGTYYKVGDQISAEAARGHEGEYKKLIHLRYKRKEYFADTNEDQIREFCRDQADNFTKITENPKDTFTAQMPDGSNPVVWETGKGKGFTGIVDIFSQLPNPASHKDEIWYVINTTIPGAMGNVWRSNGNDWISSLTLLKTKGDILSFSTEQDILSVGNDGEVIVADSASPTGLKYLAIVTGVSSVSGTANRITVSPTTGAVVVDIANTYVGQTSLTTLGTITTGTWNASVIGATYGGTGVSSYTSGDILYSAIANALTKLPIGTPGQVLTVSAGLPSWQTIVSGVSSVSGTTNRITVSPTTGAVVVDISTSYVGQASITTLGTITTGTWTGTPITGPYGGTGQSVYVIGDILYASSTSALSRLAVGSNGQVLTLAAGIPSWATPTTGTVTSVSVVSANGFAGTVATATTTPAITLTTTITGILYGNGTAISAATISTGLTIATSTLTVNLSTGISGGQTATGGTGVGENLLLQSTTNPTRGYVGVTTTVRATANFGTFSVGAGGFAGGGGNNFSGSSSGTLIAANSTNVGADLIHLQNNGVIRFRVAEDGITTISGLAPYLYIKNTNSGGSITNLYLDHTQSFSSGAETRMDFVQGSTSVVLSRIANYYSGDGTTWGLKLYASGNGSTANATPNILCHGNGRTTFGATTVPTGIIHLAAGTATASTGPIKFTLPGVVLTTREAGVMETDAEKIYYSPTSTARQAIPGVLFTQTADKTVTNTVTETSIIGTGVGSLATALTLPANFFVAGKTIRLRIGGVYTTPGAATPSIIVKVKYGSTVIATITTTALLSGATALEFDGELLITCRTTGATGTVMVHGDIEYATGVAGTIAVDPLNNAGATTTIDTTAASLIDVTVTWDSATSTRIAKSTVVTMEVIN